MIRLIEILASVYANELEKLYSNINWDLLGKDHKPTQTTIINLINEIRNIHNYEGESAVEQLNKLKDQAKNAMYILKVILENQNLD
jgi:hypothetical protein